MARKHFVPDRKAIPDSFSLREADIRYAEKVKKAGLYGKAFFGHKRSRSENWLLEKMWNESVKEAQDWKQKLDGRTARLSSTT